MTIDKEKDKDTRYEIDEDGYISSNELYHVLKQMVGNNLEV